MLITNNVMQYNKTRLQVQYL